MHGYNHEDITILFTQHSVIPKGLPQ